ncbi:MAG: TolC family protein [Burkholderiaceae bacterium]|nr:TolC family protein [Burkholderiaceae bacterium]
MKLDNTVAGAASSRALVPALLALTVLGLSACADLSGISPKAHLRDAASLGLPTTATEDFTPTTQWWRDFDDAQLSRLIEQAITANPSLKVVQARLARAQAGVDNTAAAAKLQVSVNADATQQLYSANGMVPAPLGGSVSSSGTAQINGAWELDFFGKNRAALDAALGTVGAAQADAQAARMLLATLVARSYFQLVRLNEQLGVAQQQLLQRRQLLKLVQDRVNAGMDTRLELLQAQGALPEAQLQMETLQEQLALAKNALQALVFKENVPD